MRNFFTQIFCGQCNSIETYLHDGVDGINNDADNINTFITKDVECQNCGNEKQNIQVTTIDVYEFVNQVLK